MTLNKVNSPVSKLNQKLKTSIKKLTSSLNGKSMKRNKHKKENSQNDIRVEIKTTLNNLGNTANLKLWSKWKSISKKSKWTFSHPDVLETVIEEDVQLPLGIIKFNDNPYNPKPFIQSYLGTLKKGDILQVSKIKGRCCFAQKRSGKINGSLENQKLVKDLKMVWEE